MYSEHLEKKVIFQTVIQIFTHKINLIQLTCSFNTIYSVWVFMVES